MELPATTHKIMVPGRGINIILYETYHTASDDRIDPNVIFPIDYSPPHLMNGKDAVTAFNSSAFAPIFKSSSC